MTMLHDGPPPNDAPRGQAAVCVACSAAYLAKLGCVECAQLVKFTHLAIDYVRAAEALKQRDSGRIGVTGMLVIALLAMGATLVVPARTVLGVVCALFIGLVLLAHVGCRAEFARRHRDLCRDCGIDPDDPAEPMGIPVLIRAASRLGRKPH
jgi:hypothetical protein